LINVKNKLKLSPLTVFLLKAGAVYDVTDSTGAEEKRLTFLFINLDIS